jgi:hypothetical protein
VFANGGIQLKNLLIVLMLMALSGCSDEFTAHYDTWAEASQDNAIELGWIPNFVPSSAHDIRDTHNIDTNAQILTFSVQTSDIPAMTAGMPRLNEKDAALALNFVAYADGRDQLQASTIFLTCGANANGGLFVDQATGRVIYDRSSKWDALCREQSSQ